MAKTLTNPGGCLPAEKPPDLSFLKNVRVFNLATSTCESFDELIEQAGDELNIELEFFFHNKNETQWAYMKVIGMKPVKFIPLLKIHIAKVKGVVSEGNEIGYAVKYSLDYVKDPKETFVPIKDMGRNRLLQYFSIPPQATKSKDDMCNRLLKTIILGKANEAGAERFHIGIRQGWNVHPSYAVWESIGKHPAILDNIIPESIKKRQSPYCRHYIYKTNKEIAHNFCGIFKQYPKLKVLFLIRVASYMLTFAGRYGIHFNQVIAVKPSKSVDRSLLTAILDNVNYGRGDLLTLSKPKNIEKDIELLNDAVLLVVDDTKADESKQREDGVGVLQRRAISSGTDFLQIPVVVSNFVQPQLQPDLYIELPSLDENCDISTAALTELMEVNDVRMISRIQKDFHDFIELFNRNIEEISTQTSYIIPAQRRNAFYILTAALRTYDQFFGVFFDDVENEVVTILSDYDENGSRKESLLVSQFGNCLNEEIASGRFNFIKRKKYIVFDQETDSVIVDDDYIYIETDTVKELAKNKLDLHSVNSLTEALKADGSLNINEHHSKCYSFKVQNGKGVSYDLYTYGISKLLINANNRKLLALADKEKFLLTKEELLENNILPLGVTSDGRFIGKDIDYINKSNNSQFVTGRSGKGKSFNITNSLPILRMLGNKLTVFDVSCSFTRDEVLRAFDQDERLVNAFFEFIDVDDGKGKFPYNPLYVGDCPNLPAKKRRIYGFVSAVASVDKDKTEIVKGAISNMLQFHKDEAFITRKMLHAALVSTRQITTAETVNSVLKVIEQIGCENKGYGDFIKDTTKIPVIQLGDEIGESVHAILDALLSAAFEWQRNHNTTPLTLVLDEIKYQNFSVGSPLHTILTQGRKFNTSMIGMTQELVSRDSHSYYVMREADIKKVFEPANSLDAVAVQLGFRNAVDADLANMDKWEFYLKCDAYNKVDGCNDSAVIRCYTVKFKDTLFYDEFKKQHGWNC